MRIIIILLVFIPFACALPNITLLTNTTTNFNGNITIACQVQDTTPLNNITLMWGTSLRTINVSLNNQETFLSTITSTPTIIADLDNDDINETVEICDRFDQPLCTPSQDGKHLIINLSTSGLQYIPLLTPSQTPANVGFSGTILGNIHTPIGTVAALSTTGTTTTSYQIDANQIKIHKGYAQLPDIDSDERNDSVIANATNIHIVTGSETLNYSIQNSTIGSYGSMTITSLLNISFTLFPIYTKSLYNTSNTIENASANLTDLNDGTYYWTCKSKTTTATPNSFIINKDLTPPPGVSNLNTYNFTNETISWNWTTSGDTNYTLLELNNISYANITTTSIIITGLQPLTNYTLSIRSVDDKGNVNQSAIQHTTQTLATPDTTPPTITNLTISVSYETTTIMINATEQVNLTLRYDENITINTSFVQNHTITLNGLAANTTYNFNFTLTDPSGNMYITTNQNFTTLEDTTPPLGVENITILSKTNTSLYWSWDSTEIALIYLDGINIINTTNTYNATNLAPNTSYELGIRTKDRYGNLNLTMINATATTLPTQDTQQPLILNITTTTTNESIALIIQANELVNISVQYGTTTNYNSTFATTHQITLNNLQSKTQYFYNITITDTSNNTLTQGYNTTTNRTPGTAIQILSSTLTTTLNSATISIVLEDTFNATLLWGLNTTNNFYQSSTFTTSHFFSLQNLFPNTQYFYTFRFNDQNNNLFISEVFNFTTLAAPSFFLVSDYFVAPPCFEWVCSEWDHCSEEGITFRRCHNAGTCLGETGKPTEVSSCTPDQTNFIIKQGDLRQPVIVEQESAQTIEPPIENYEPPQIRKQESEVPEPITLSFIYPSIALLLTGIVILAKHILHKK